MKKSLLLYIFIFLTFHTLHAQFVLADFTTSSTSICTGQSVTFTNTSITGGGAAAINSWTWNFDFTSVGGATPSTANTAGPHVVTFNTAGSYLVRLTVGNGTQSDTKSIAINVSVGIPVPITEGFEGTFPAAGWSVTNTAGSLNWGQNNTTGQSSSKSVWVDLYSNNINTNSLYLNLPRINLTGYVGGTVQFYVAHRGFSGRYATLTLEASTDCGINYTQVWQKTGTALATTTPTDGSELNTPTAGEWRLESADISSLTGNPAVQFRFKLQDNNSTNNIFLDNINITAFTSTPPNDPSTLVANAPVFNQVNLTWVDNSNNEFGFKLERSIDNINFSQIGGNLPANTTSYTDNTVSTNTTYYYRVRSYIGTIHSNYSNTATVTTPTVSLNAPSGLMATAVSSSRINLAWTDNDVNEQGYKIERSLDGTNYTEIASNLSTNSTNYSDLSLSPGTLYYYRVRCFLGAVDSPYSNVTQATTFVVITAPTTLTATATSATSINLTWTDNSTNETGYKVERSTDGLIFTEIASSLPANSNIYSDASLSSGILYFYRVRAFNGTIFSNYSNTAQATTTVTIAAPSSLQANAVSPTQINLTWTDNANNEAGFRIERSTDGTTFTDLGGGLPINATTFEDGGLIPNTKYFYRIKAFNGPLLNSSFSNVAEATTPLPTAIKNDISNNIVIYPNPNNGNFVVDLSESSIQVQSIILYNSIGAKVYEIPSTIDKKLNIELTNIAKGIYYININSQDSKAIKKIVIH
ncbi:MAG: fibronectin type III domain-containing protein [Raineya sp.]|jgi:hypothetical protein|nr:fibronectin type III domain-containing protein [Raineya sp.]